MGVAEGASISKGPTLPWGSAGANQGLAQATSSQKNPSELPSPPSWRNRRRSCQRSPRGAGRSQSSGSPQSTRVVDDRAGENASRDQRQGASDGTEISAVLSQLLVNRIHLDCNLRVEQAELLLHLSVDVLQLRVDVADHVGKTRKLNPKELLRLLQLPPTALNPTTAASHRGARWSGRGPGRRRCRRSARRRAPRGAARSPGPSAAAPQTCGTR